MNNFPPVHGDASHDQHSKTIYLKDGAGGEGGGGGGERGGCQVCSLSTENPQLIYPQFSTKVNCLLFTSATKGQLTSFCLGVL